VRIDLLKTTTTEKKRNMNWAFLMVANPEVMDEKVQTWYAAQRDIILNQLTDLHPVYLDAEHCGNAITTGGGGRDHHCRG
jgi:hypothetical protein